MNGKNRERGAVMVWALIFVIVTAGMIISHSAYMASHRQSMDVHLKRKPLAANMARAALTDGLSWFQSQATQPVMSFAPVRDEAANPPVIDTLDPTVGLVREFEIRGNLWGRYEIRKNEAMDASLQYGAPLGSVWDLAARAFVYRREDAGRSFDEAPNKVVSMSRVETTIRTVPLHLPASAALGIDDISRLTLGPGGKLAGGNTAGVATVQQDPIPAAAATAIATLTPLVNGTPGIVTLPSYLSGPENVFRMSLPHLRDIADFVAATGSARWLLRPLPENVIVYHNGDLTVASTHRLAGTMMLVVEGNLTVQADSNSAIDGMIYVTGNTDIRGPFLLRGMLIAKGNVALQGNGAGQDAVIQHSSSILSRLMQAMARYRASRTVRCLDKNESRGPQTPPIVGAGTVVSPTAEFEGVVILGSGVFVHDGVRIANGTTVGDSVTIGQRVWVGKNVQVGNGVTIGSTSRVDDLAIIGAGATIGSGVAIGAGARIAPGAIIPDGTVIRCGATFP